MTFWKHLTVGAALIVAGCGFSPTSPFEGFDEQGTRVQGHFESGVTASDTEVRASSASPQGIRVYLRERSSVSAVVDGNGGFKLVGLPSGAWSLVFERDGRVVGEIRFRSVRQNQEITIVVTLTDRDEVVLVQETRDRVSFEGECARGAGFWCQNKDGQNPNLSPGEFDEFLAAAQGYLDGLEQPIDIEAAVCNQGDQLRRQLATLALNLAAGTLSEDDAAEALQAGIEAANGSLSRDDRNEVKDTIEAFNEGQNTTDSCDALPDDDGDDDGGPPSSGEMTICHYPPGNPAARHTITIDASAWPAHKGHGDTIGPCS
jgi:hypothetical protein